MEVASRLRKRGAEVDLVILLDTILPQGVHSNWGKWLRTQAAEIQKGNGAKVLRTGMSKLKDKAIRRFPLAAGRTAEPSMEQAFELRQAAFYQAIGTWDTQGLVSDFQVVLFRAAEQSWGEHVAFEEDYGWRHHLKGSLQVVPVPGDHLGIIKPPNVSELARKAQQYLVRKDSYVV